MRIALLTERADSRTWSAEGSWCARLAEGLPEHEFELCPLEALPGTGTDVPSERVRLRAAERMRRGPVLGLRRRRALAAYGELVSALADQRRVESFPDALYALADAARGGGLTALLRSGAAVDTLHRAWQAPGASLAAEAGAPVLQDALVAADLLERALRPLSLAWQEGGPERVDLCHVLGGGPALLPALLAKRFHGVPLVLTEHGLHLRERLRGYRDAPYGLPVRALLHAFHLQLAKEGYRQAGLITPGSAFDQRWQEYCGADPGRIRVVYEGTTAADRPEAGPEPERPTLAWVGPIAPHGGLLEALRAFGELRERHQGLRLRVFGEIPPGAEEYARACRAAAEEFGEDARFGGWSGPAAAGAGWVVLLSGSEGPRPRLLAELMLTGRPVVGTDVGVMRELLGPTGLLVPPGEHGPLVETCSALLGDAERRARLGRAGRQRAQELYAVAPAVEAFREVYLELAGQVAPVPEAAAAAPTRRPQPFARPAEYWLGVRTG
jgi:glycosyltransferase involved in cell wall biosynthesis